MTSNWNKTKKWLKDHLNTQVFETWINPLTINEISDTEIKINAPSAFIKDWVTDNYINALNEAVKETIGVALDITILVSDEETMPSAARISRIPTANTVSPANDYRKRLNPKYTFSNFIIGTSNQLPHAASMAVASEIGTRYNPLFIYGGVGLGKTHLLHAIGNQLLAKNPNTRIFYLSAEEFMNEFVLKLKTNAMDSFQAKFRNSCDILLIDDIQFIAGKKHIQDEFFHTFNALQQKQKQIVLTSDKYPQEISDLEARLKSRFLQGLIADIQSPDMETRLAILKRKADDENILLPDEVALFLATSMKTNVRELEGALINLAAHSSLENVPIDIDFATRTLNKIVVLREISLSVENIQKAVCKHFNITVDELTGSSRQRSIAYPRQVAMYLCRKGLQSSFPEIGKKFGGKDHTTAMAACRRIEMKIKQDVSARSKIDTLERMLGF